VLRSENTVLGATLDADRVDLAIIWRGVLTEVGGEALVRAQVERGLGVEVARQGVRGDTLVRNGLRRCSTATCGCMESGRTRMASRSSLTWAVEASPTSL
jgi:hypothetical protein